MLYQSRVQHFPLTLIPVTLLIVTANKVILEKLCMCVCVCVCVFLCIVNAYERN